MVWETFHVLLNLFEILNSVFSVVILIPRQMENPYRNNLANNTDEHPQGERSPQAIGQ